MLEPRWLLAGINSDDFNAGTLNPQWTFTDPIGDATVEVDGTSALITVPGTGAAHNVTGSGINRTARITQAVSDTDFGMEAKFETAPSGRFAYEGVLVEEDGGDYLLFEFRSDPRRTIRASIVSGSVITLVNDQVAIDGPVTMRVTRSGNQWTQSYSTDGQNFTTAISFSHAMAVDRAGVYAGNHGGDGSPAFTSIVDYAFDIDNPISPEDANPAIDTTAPLNTQIQLDAVGTAITADWMTNDSAVGSIDYGLTDQYELGTVSEVAAGENHSVQIAGLDPFTTYYLRINSTNEFNGLTSQEANYLVRTEAAPQNAPIIDIWYGDDQQFGQLGNPQTWVNIPGNVSDSDGVATLTYELNASGNILPLTIGANSNRLVGDGDFNIDIDQTLLAQGANAIEIVATDNLGNQTAETISFTYDGTQTWPVDYVAQWGTVTNINDTAQVVDGLWTLTPGGLRTLEPGYDRLVNLGNIDATDFEVTVPITIHHWQENVGAVPAAGMLLRWQGHFEDGNQPHTSWWPIGALGWAKLGGLGLVGNEVNSLVSPATLSREIALETTYIHKMKVESNPGGPSTYSYKVWNESDPEPAAWDLVGDGPVDELANGSVILTAHYADATFGDVVICSDGECDIQAVLDSDPDDNFVAENGPFGATVGITASAIDPDPGDVVTYTLTESAGGRFDIDPSSGVVTTTTSLDFETSQSHLITVLATSSDGSTSTADFIINVGNESDTLEPESFFIVDSGSVQAFEYDSNFNQLGVTALNTANNDSVGITTTAAYENYWVLNDDGTVFVYDATFTLQGSWQATGLTDPEGIATNGEDIWITDIIADSVFFYDDAALLTSGFASPDSSFALEANNNFPYGLTMAGNSLWVLNSGAAVQVFKYSTDGTFQGKFNVQDPGIEGRGITVDPGSPANIWITDITGDQVYRYNDAASLVSNENRFADAIFQLPAANNFAQGIAPFRTTTGPVGAIVDIDPASDEVFENTIIGSAVGVTIFANEPDVSESVTYSLDDDAGGRFAIDPNTGVVTTAAVLDQSSGNSHSITVRATSTDTTTSTATLEIVVLEQELQGGLFFVADQNTAKTWVYDADLNFVESHNAASQPRGITTNVSGSKIWTVDRLGKVSVFDRDANLLGSWDALGVTTPEGITTNGEDIWILDSGGNGADRVRFFDNAASLLTGSAANTSNFQLQGDNNEAWGIATDGQHLWVVNTFPNLDIYKYTINGSLVGSWVVTDNIATARGIAVDPSGAVDDLWVVLRGPDEILQFDGGANHTSGTFAADSTTDLQPANTTAHGIAKSGAALNPDPTVTVDTLFTNNASPLLTGTVDDPTAIVTVTVDGDSYTATNNQDGTWILSAGTISPPLNAGIFDVAVDAVDTGGNSGSDSTTNELTIDLVAPVVTVDTLITNDSTPPLTGTVSEPSAAISVTVAGNTYSGTNNGDGTWTLADNLVASLASGVYDVAAAATDVAGNVGNDATNSELTVDLVAPAVTVDVLATNDPSPALTGTISDPTASISVTIDGNQYPATNNGDGTWTLPDDTISPDLVQDVYDVAATATDSAGNTGTDGTVDEVTIDAAPNVGINTLVSTDTTPGLTGVVNDPAATVTVTVAGNTYSATNNEDGTWTLPDDTITPPLAEGVYDLVATATDLGGNVGLDTTIDELNIDLTGPVVGVDALLTSDTTPSLTGTTDDPTAIVTVILDGSAYTAVNNGDGTWTLPDDVIAPPLTNGVYDVAATATDVVGNSGSDATLDELEIDVAPTVTIDIQATNDATPELTGTVDDPSATIEVTVDGTAYAAFNNGDGTWTLADDIISPALTAGIYEVDVTATDAIGNVGSDATNNELTIDFTAPVVSVDVKITTDSSPRLTGNVDDPTAAIEVTVAGNTYSAINNGDGTWTLLDNTVAPPLSAGFYNVTVSATDPAGNVGIDGTASELGINPAPSVTVDPLATNDNTPELTGTVDDPSATVTVKVDGITYVATNNGDGTWILPDNVIDPPLADGVYNVAVSAFDTTGNVGSDPTNDELTIDATHPVVTVNTLISSDSTPELTGTIDDPTAVVIVSLYFDSYLATNNGDGTWTLPDDVISPPLPNGIYNVAATAIDPAGNSSGDSTTAELAVGASPIITVDVTTTSDTTPVLTGTVSAPLAEITLTVDGNTYAAVNNGDGTWTLPNNTISPPLLLTTYDVSVTAVDISGYVGSDSSIDELTVLSGAPTVTIDSLATNDSTPQLTGTVNDPGADISVTVGGNTYTGTNNANGTWTLPNGAITSPLADGVYDLVVTATDGFGNVGSDGTLDELTVETIAPVVGVDVLTTNDTTPALTGSVDDPAAALLVTVDGTSYAATNNGDGTWTLVDDTIAPALASGVFDVAASATDLFGNIGSDSTTDELTIDLAPSITVDPLTTNDTTPPLTGTVDDVAATIAITVGGSSFSATNNGDGTWTLADNVITPALAEGLYDVAAVATDGFGNAGTDATIDELLLDITPPQVTVNTLITSDSSPALTGDIDDPNATLAVTVDGNTYAAVNNGDGSWTLADDTISPPLPNGFYDVVVTATDPIGNVGTDGSVSELGITGTPNVTVDPLSTNDPTPQLTGGVDDNDATVSITVNGNTYPATNNGDGTWTLADNAITPPLADGVYDVVAAAENVAGNVGADSTNNELMVDSIAPSIAVDTLATSDPTPQLTGTVDDPNAGISVTVDGTTYAAANHGDGTWTLADGAISIALADGVYDVLATAIDSFGNVGNDGGSGELTVDTTAPVVGVDSLLANDATPELTGTVDDPTAAIGVTVDGNLYTATNNGDGSWTLADDTIAPELAEGIYDVAVTGTDPIGNVGSDATTDELEVDVPPVVTVDLLTTSDVTPPLTGTINHPTLPVTVRVLGVDYVAINNGDGTWTLGDDAIAPLADGEYNVLASATDSGGTGFDTTDGELTIDTVAPTVAVDGLTTNDTTPRLTGTVNDPAAAIVIAVDGSTYSATNNGDGTWTLADDTITPSLSDDVYDVAATATDAANNVGNDISIDELTIDTQAPVVTVDVLTTVDSTPPLTGSVTDPGATISVSVSGKTYTAVNNGDGSWTLPDNTITPALFDGIYNVSVTATDAATNASSDSTLNELTVDTAAPLITVNPKTTGDTTPQLSGTVNDLSATISVAVGGNSYPALNNGNGTWTLANDTIAPALAEGTYSVVATATDPVGNVGTDNTNNELTIDTTLPSITVNSLITNDTTPAVSGTVDDPAATITVTVAGNGYTATNNGNGTWTLADNTISPALADGIYDIVAVATDPAGNQGTDASTDELTISTTAPSVTVDPLNTNDTTPALTGTVENPSATVDLTVDGTTYPATNNGDGTWTLADDTISPALADGTYDVQITATDEAGNVANDSTVNELTVDSTAPVVTVNSLSTNDTTPPLSGIVTDLSATVAVTVNGSTYAATNNGNGTWTLPDNVITPALAEGTFDVTVVATDSLGNAGSDGTVNELTIDATAPVVSVTPLTTGDTTPPLVGNVNDATASVSLLVDGVNYSATNNGDGTWTLADNTIAPLADGVYNIVATAVDGVGNQGSDSTTNELTIDTDAPVVTIDFLVTNDTSPQLTGTVDETDATVSVTIAGTTYVANNNGDTTWTLADNTIAPALAEGVYEVFASAVDNLGNVGTDGTSDELVIDTTLPDVTVDPLTTSNSSPQLTGTSNNATAAIAVTVGGNQYTATNNGNGTWTLPAGTITPALGEGVHDVAVSATDEAGNVGSDLTTDELTIDTTAPTPTVDLLTTTDSTPELGGSVNDPAAGISVSVDGVSYAATNNGNGTWTLADNTVAPPLADGVYNVGVTATDAAGNVGSDSTTAELTIDSTPPSVTVNSLATIDTTPPLSGTVDDPTATVSLLVDGQPYSATNNGDGTWTLPNNLISPPLADGVYDVSATAADGLGNQASDASTNELTIDTTAPVVTVNASTTSDTTPELSGTVDDATATISANVGGQNYSATNHGDGTWSVANGVITSPLADGTYDVSLTAIDSLGNVGNDGTTNELIIDTAAPTITVNSLTTSDTTPELTGSVTEPGASVVVTVDGSSYPATNNGDGSWTLADNSISAPLTAGVYNVVATATDVAGNVGSDGSTSELTIDVPPVVSVDTLTTDDDTPPLTGTVDDPSATISVTVGGNTYAATNNGDGTWTLLDNTISPPLLDGTFDVAATATDLGGNVGSDSTTDELTVGVPPTVTVNSLTSSDTTPQLTGTVDDSSAALAVTVNGSTYAATNNGDGTWTLADNVVSPALAEGTYDVSVVATDTGGNVGSDTTLDELTIDVAPTVSVNNMVTGDSSPPLTGTVDDPAASISVTVDGSTYAATNNGDGSWTLADDTIAPDLAEGVYDVAVTATDGGGNVGTDSTSNELTITPPTKFFVVNNGNPDRTYKYDPSGDLVEDFNLGPGNNTPRGVATDATASVLWVVDGDDNVYVYDALGTPLRSWKAGGIGAAEGIAVAGDDLWIADRSNDRVFFFDGGATRTTNTNSTSSFPLASGNSTPRGLTTDGTFLWVVNSASVDMVYKYDLAGNLVGSWDLDSQNVNPRGITIDLTNPSDLWVVDRSTRLVYLYSGGADRTSGSQSATSSFALAAGNTVPEGIADPEVSLAAVNVSPPVITAGQSFTIPDDAGTGTSVGTIAVTDPDPLSTFESWQIIAGNDDSVFEIEGSTGELRIADGSGLNAQVTPSYTLTMTVNDGIHTSASETVAIDVVVAPSAKFYVVDRSSNGNVAYDADGNPFAEIGLDAANRSPRGATTDALGTTLWVLDGNDSIYAYDLESGSINSWRSTGLSLPEGIATDGQDLWIADRGSDRVYYYSDGANHTSESSPDSSFVLATGNGTPRGITTDGTYLWVVNDSSTDDEVYKYDLSGLLLGSWTIDVGSSSPRGITVDPENSGTLWVLDSETLQVFEFLNATDQTSGSLSPASSFDLAPGSSLPEGIADPYPRSAAANAATDENLSRVLRLADTTRISFDPPNLPKQEDRETWEQSDSELVVEAGPPVPAVEISLAPVNDREQQPVDEIWERLEDVWEDDIVSDELLTDVASSSSASKVHQSR